MKRIGLLFIAMLVLGCMAWSADMTWTGAISDSHCGAKHATASDQAAACVKKCADGGAKYVFVSKGKVYQLEPQDKFAEHAGHRVQITGTMSGETITATEVAMVAGGGEKKKAE